MPELHSNQLVTCRYCQKKIKYLDDFGWYGETCCKKCFTKNNNSEDKK